MALTDAQLFAAIRAFAATISSQTLGLAHYQPHARAIHTNCIANALAIAEANGGQVRFGWHFIFRTSPIYGDYLVATHHAVWHDPSDLNLVDVTPKHPDEKHQPISQDGDVLFLVDDSATPFEYGTHLVPLPLRFFAVGNSPALSKYVDELQQAENQDFNAQFGSQFS